MLALLLAVVAMVVVVPPFGPLFILCCLFTSMIFCFVTPFGSVPRTPVAARRKTPRAVAFHQGRERAKVQLARKKKISAD